MRPDARQRDRVLPLDGLRGLLAMGVFLGHASFYSAYWRDGAWQADSVFWATIGPVAVSLFFMITAFLFYGRLLDERGRPAWRRLYVGRLFRLAPVYLLAIAALFVIVAVASDWHLRVPPGQLVGEVASWLALGAGPRVDLNAYPDTRHLLAGVTWTLQSEWLFYAGMLLLALAARSGSAGRVALAMPIGGLIASLIALAIFGADTVPACLGPFCAGMLSAILHRKKLPTLPAWLASSLIVALLAAIVAGGLNPRVPAAVLLLGTAFYLIVSGGTMFGLLTCRSVRWLGEISYGVYLFHGLVLYALSTFPPIRAMALGSTAGHWCMVLLATGGVLILADLAHRLIEAPGIALGRRIGSRLVVPHARAARSAAFVDRTA